MKKISFEEVISGRSKGLFIGVAVISVFFAFGVWWIFQPSYVSLYKDASETGRAEITALLTQQSIPYQLGKDGVIEVVSTNLNKARKALVEAGLPAKHSTGFEIFDNSDYGMSEFAQKINYQRALEGELARSLMGLREIKFARVHLVLKKNSLYSSQEELSKASVILQLRAGMALDKKQLSGIQQLIAASVDGLLPEAVVVIDEDGQPLNGYQNYSGFDDRWQISTRLERELQAKAQSVLDRIYGVDAAQASVRVQMNFDRVKSVKELPVSIDGSGNGIVIKKKQQSYDQKQDGAKSEAGAGKQQHSDEVEYAVGKNHSEIEYSQGKIERISVGVILSDGLAGGDMQQLDELLSATLGLNDERGDRLSIAHMPMTAAKAGLQSANYSAASVAPIQKKAAGGQVEWWQILVIVMAAIFITITAVILQKKPKAKPVARADITAAERDKLLQDVRGWLARDAHGEAP